MFKRDPFGHLLFLKRALISTIGLVTWGRYNRKNSIVIKGAEKLVDLPNRNVLFVSNHQTYFADVIAMVHVFCSVKNGQLNTLAKKRYLFRPKVNAYFVAAVETMKKGFLPRIFSYAGSVSIERTWKKEGEDINRKVRMEDLSRIALALGDGWVINFPQGTTKVNAPGRRGVTLLIKKYQPVVVPVVIDGFRRAFDKKGLKLKKKGVKLTMTFKDPLAFGVNDDADHMLAAIMDSIEQSERFHWTPKKNMEPIF